MAVSILSAVTFPAIDYIGAGEYVVVQIWVGRNSRVRHSDDGTPALVELVYRIDLEESKVPLIAADAGDASFCGFFSGLSSW